MKTRTLAIMYMKKTIVLFFAMLMVVSLISCGGEKPSINESENDILTEEITWQDDASNTLVTGFFYWTYERGHGLQGSSATGQTLDNICNRIRYYYREGFEKNLFFDKFLELYETYNIDSETAKKRDLYSLYVYMNGYLDYDLTEIKDAYSMGYQDDGNIDYDVLEGRRGFIFDISGQIIVVIVGDVSLTFEVKRYSYNDFSEKYKTTLSQQNGIMNGTYLGISVLDDFTYTYEDNNLFADIATNELVMMLTEYMEIYEQHRGDILKPVVDDAELIGKPQIGMSETEVENGKWGKPQKINRTETQYGTFEQWVYGNGRYVYIDNGVVVSIQEEH